MHQTYELYVQPPEGPAVFEPLTCASERDLLALVRRVLAERAAAAVEVRRHGEHLFTLQA